MTPLSVRARLTLWYTLALLVILSLFGADVLWIQGRLGLGRVDRELDAVVITIANIVDSELKEHATPADAANEAVHEVTAPGRAVAVLDADGRTLAANWGALRLDELPRADAEPASWTAQTHAGAWRVHAAPRSFGETTFVVVSASPLEDVRREQREVQEAMIVGIPIALALAAACGLWLAGVSLRPITDMSARLRAALQTQRQFMADASHELRTPVSIIRSASEVSLGRDHRDEPEYRDTLAIVQAQARRLGRLVGDMLVLARADAGGQTLQPVELYLNDLVADCERAVAVLARGRGVRIETAPAAETPFVGDEELLRQMLVNVMQNAVQHTPPAGVVAVRLDASDQAIRIAIADSGAGIAEVDRDRIFDRFVQLDPARRSEGTGLGLPIARWIAEAHGGRLDLEQSGPSGSMFVVTFPR